MGPLVNAGRVRAVHEYTEIGKARGRDVGDRRHVVQTRAAGRGAYYAPTIFSDVKPTMRIAREEIFGPVRR